MLCNVRCKHGLSIDDVVCLLSVLEVTVVNAPQRHRTAGEDTCPLPFKKRPMPEVIEKPISGHCCIDADPGPSNSQQLSVQTQPSGGAPEDHLLLRETISPAAADAILPAAPINGLTSPISQTSRPSATAKMAQRPQSELPPYVPRIKSYLTTEEAPTSSVQSHPWKVPAVPAVSISRNQKRPVAQIGSEKTSIFDRYGASTPCTGAMLLDAH